uniref:Uncharacterized protein n=1 Tax=Arundo donax TaxID=35708 RepID=A0A0A9B2A7_ARUDO
MTRATSNKETYRIGRFHYTTYPSV